MAKIKPFRGVLYNAKKIDIAKAVAPPYDVISSDMQDGLYAKDENNIVRIILGKEKASDTPKSNKYSRAGTLFDTWYRQKIFIKDKKPSIYVYTQQYLHKGKKRFRIGFIALMKIEDPRKSGVLPHEYTLDKPKKDRLNLIKRTRANLSPIFSLFQDKENRVNKILRNFIKVREPLFAIDADQVMHKFWRMDKRCAIDKIKRYMRDKKIFIADGHHRYEVALAYQDMMRKTKAFNKNMDYVMMYFSNLSEKGGNITVLSTHRVVSNAGRFEKSKIRLKFKKYFHVKNMRSIESLIEKLDGSKRKHIFGVYTGEKKFYLLTLRKTSRLLKKLDVAILHDLVIGEILGIKSAESSIKYIRDEKIALSLIDRGDYGLAFFLKPTAVSVMKAVAEKGEMMPQKSTYFYPKLLTGLVINKF